MENGRLSSRRDLLNQFDRFRRDLEPALGEIDEFRSSAYHILTSPHVADAFDLNKESEETRDRYGRHRWGQSCLLARRLAEAGTAVINIDATAPNNTTKNFSWDDHAGAFHLDYAQRERLPQVDQALTALKAWERHDMRQRDDYDPLTLPKKFIRFRGIIQEGKAQTPKE